MDKKEIEKQILEDIKNYTMDKTSVKAYSQSMGEMDKWLSELKK